MEELGLDCNSKESIISLVRICIKNSPQYYKELKEFVLTKINEDELKNIIKMLQLQEPTL